MGIVKTDLTGFSFQSLTDDNFLNLQNVADFGAYSNAAASDFGLVGIQQGGDAAALLLISDSSENQFYETVDDVDDSGGGGPLNEIYEPEVLIPEGFTIEDHVGTEFIINERTGELTIILHFASDDVVGANSNSGAETLAAYGLVSSDTDASGLIFPGGLGDLDVEENSRRTCTVTITKTVTHNSGSATLNVNMGVAGGTRTSPSTSTTTTTTVTYQGVQINGRCYIPKN